MNKNNLNKDKIDCNGSFTDSLILTANGDIIIYIEEKEDNDKINEKESKKENIKIQNILFSNYNGGGYFYNVILDSRINEI